MARCLIIGCGSIGSRRARLLQEMGHEVMGHDERAHNLPLWDGRQVDAAFVCTPADVRLGPVAFACAASPAVFIEKPLALNMESVESVLRALRDVPVTMVACNLRWAYSHVPHGVDALDLRSMRPLSNWRPGAEAAYRSNGMVMESLIHELDFAASRLGKIQRLDAMWWDQDEVTLSVEHERGLSTIHGAWGEDAPVVRDCTTPRGICEPDVSDRMYVGEMRHFLDCVERGVQTVNPVEHAAEVTRWAIQAQERCPTSSTRVA